MKLILLGAFSLCVAGCETSGRPMSAVPDAQAPVTYREPGVANTPRNTGNLPADLRPNNPQSTY